MLGDFNTLLSMINKTSRQKISKDIDHLNNPINQNDLTFTEHSTPEENIYTCFSSMYEIFNAPR